MTFKTIDDVWNAVNKGMTVYWCTKAYKVFVESNPKQYQGCENQFYNSPARQYSTRGEKMLAVRCIENHFGGVISESNLGSLFVTEKEPTTLRDILLNNGLTNRQCKVAELVTKDLSNKEIAERLYVTEKTIKFHLAQIYKKLGVKSRAQLIVWCLPYMGFGSN
jgi:DNA-binding CsgD family transcriptional regulator